MTWLGFCCGQNWYSNSKALFTFKHSQADFPFYTRSNDWKLSGDPYCCHQYLLFYTVSLLQLTYTYTAYTMLMWRYDDAFFKYFTLTGLVRLMHENETCLLWPIRHLTPQTCGSHWIKCGGKTMPLYWLCLAETPLRNKGVEKNTKACTHTQTAICHGCWQPGHHLPL